MARKERAHKYKKPRSPNKLRPKRRITHARVRQQQGNRESYEDPWIFEPETGRSKDQTRG
jgi:hypothetical protein